VRSPEGTHEKGTKTVRRRPGLPSSGRGINPYKNRKIGLNGTQSQPTLPWEKKKDSAEQGFLPPSAKCHEAFAPGTDGEKKKAYESVGHTHPISLQSTPFLSRKFRKYCGIPCIVAILLDRLVKADIQAKQKGTSGQQRLHDSKPHALQKKPVHKTAS